MRYGPPFKTSSEMAWLTLKTALHGKKELLDVSFSCQGTTRYHSLSWHFLILVLALFDRKVKMQPGINSENMIHSLWVGWATTPHIGFEILNWFKIPMMVVKGVSSKPSGNTQEDCTNFLLLGLETSNFGYLLKLCTVKGNLKSLTLKTKKLVQPSCFQKVWKILL